MDSLLDKLEPLSSKRRTTYKKALESQEQEETQQIPNSPPAILGNGFLFQNSTIDKVRNRLKTIEAGPNEKAEQQVEDKAEQEKNQSNQTQVISDLYEGAEELEGGKKEEAMQLSSPKKNISVTQERTQTISSEPSEEWAQNDNKRNAGTSDYNIHKSSTTVNDAQTTQPIQSFHRTMTEPLAETTTELERTSQVSIYAPINEDRLDTQQQSTQQTFQDLEITQLDASKSLLFQPTVSDNDKYPQRLKIHDIEKELEEERKEREHLRNKEHKVTTKSVNSRRVFSKEAFLRNFDEESNSEDELIELNNKEAKNKQVEKDGKFSENTKEAAGNRGVFRAYERKLKGELDSKMCIQLDDDNESEGDQEVPSSRVSKATVLDIKARKSKQEPLSMMKQKRTTLNDLICTLKKASKKQVSDHQKELMERRGYKLEDIEKQKEEVENLLEQEITRNKRIARREKGQEMLEDLGESDKSIESANECMDSDYSDIEYSGDSELGNEQDEHLDTDGQDFPGTKSEELFESDYGDKETQNVNADEEEEDSVRKGRVKNSKTHLMEDVDSEEDTALPTNVIDLGTYGNNLQVNRKQDVIEPLSDHNEEHKSNELLIERIKRIEMKKNQRKQRIKELKSKGLTKMFEMEAEESEDEWKGIGGADGEFSDEHDSDLEEMIDDLTKSNENSDNIRQLLAKEDKELDDKLVNKILYDIKNGGFRKRGRNALDLELSDDEDENLRSYRLKRRELMKKSRLEDKDKEKVFKNAKSKAFLNSMVDDIDESKNPFGDPDIDGEDNPDKDSQEFGPNANKAKHTLSQEFVQKSLSFLRDNNGSREFELRDHTVMENGEQDILSLKRNSGIHALHKTSDPVSEDLEKENQDEDIITLPDFKPPSLVKSLAGGLDFNNKFQSGRKTVTVSNSYRAVGGSRSSITYFGRMRKLVGPKSKIQASSRGSRPLTRPTMGKLWDSQQNSFET